MNRLLEFTDSNNISIDNVHVFRELTFWLTTRLALGKHSN